MNEALEKAHETLKRMAEEGIKPKVLNPIEKLKEKPTRVNAIRAMCYQCFGAEGADPGWKNHIRHCTAKDCALYQFRPYK